MQSDDATDGTLRVLVGAGHATRILGVKDPRTVSRLALLGEIEGFRTPGGHWRYDLESIHRLVERSQIPQRIGDAQAS